ncbi:MAG: hypothetical protein CMB80_11435 [Flammeovirgaceae bacterium]|nr:hypothetical protein [Flammeovirgaceae bacterium]MBE60986.1 hypothetical protein [Flammeovirgaceae bacterium]HCX20642.1 hypothetical protein [Cytophagales bacterium]|tara:strand:- start:899 stop:1735 length:837 start_codon:yes stop_codon:yes gene_type:complete
MQRYFSKYALNVFQLDLEEWIYPIHNHNFFELILIKSGSGSHRLNDVEFEYHQGDVFLLTPEDHHDFKINTPTSFIYIKFTEQLFDEKEEWKDKLWQKRIRQVITMPNTIPESIVKDESDQQSLLALAEVMLKEFSVTSTLSRPLLLNLFSSIFIILLRNLAGKIASISKVKLEERQKVSELLTYIRQNIGAREKLTQKQLSEEFSISQNYVSIYLRKHTGMRLQNLITETRLKTAERLIKQSSLPMSQIAEKVGFTDGSHMNKMFQKYRKVNPSELR